MLIAGQVQGTCPDRAKAKLLRISRQPQRGCPVGRQRRVHKDKRGQKPLPASQCFALSRPGGHGGAAAPVPIPNTAVKRPSANGTSSQDAGE